MIVLSDSGVHCKEDEMPKNAHNLVPKMCVSIFEWEFTFQCLEIKFTVDADYQKNASGVIGYLLDIFPSIVQYKLEEGSGILHIWAALDPSIGRGLQHLQKGQLVIPGLNPKAEYEITLPNSTNGGRGTTLTVKKPKDIDLHMKPIARAVGTKSLMPSGVPSNFGLEVILPEDVAGILHNLASYEHGWDGDDGEPIERRAIEIGKIVLAYLYRDKLPIPEIYGAPSGAVDFSWSALGIIATIYGDELLIPEIPKEFDKGVSFELDKVPSIAAIMVCNLIFPALQSETNRTV